MKRKNIAVVAAAVLGTVVLAGTAEPAAGKTETQKTLAAMLWTQFGCDYEVGSYAPMSGDEYDRFVRIVNTGDRDGHISDQDLHWALSEMQPVTELPYLTDERREIVMTNLTHIGHFSQHQRDLYLPVLLSFAKTPYYHNQCQVLSSLWSLKDRRAAPAVAVLVQELNKTLTPRQRLKFSKFIQHCQN